MSEICQRWHEAPPIHWPSSAIHVLEDHVGLTLTLVFSQTVDGPDRDLRLKFGRVIALASYEEFAHPWNDSGGDVPRLEGKWNNHAYPCLVVKNSEWLQSFGDSRLFGRENVEHLRFVSLDKTIDVLTDATIEVSWVAAETPPNSA